MTKRGDPKLFQVLVCQMRQDTKIDVVLSKALRVLSETELLKPVRNLLHRGPVSGGFCLGLTELLDPGRFSDGTPGMVRPRSKQAKQMCSTVDGCQGWRRLGGLREMSG